jgi:hypothetical protein
MIFCDWSRDSNVIRRIKPTKPCAGCGESIKVAKAPNFYCVSCKDKSMTLRFRLYRKVRAAIERGELEPIGPKTKCIDCGDKAYGYEHRDWLKPLDVVPICRACNWKRGPAANLRYV